MKTKFFILFALAIMSVAASAEVVWRDGSSADVRYDNSNNNWSVADRPNSYYTTTDGDYENHRGNGPSRIQRGSTPGGVSGAFVFNPGIKATDGTSGPVGDAIPTLMVLVAGFVLIKFRKQIAAFIKR